ncbi:MAG: flagellar hook-length control protein FliK [Bryobacteraceae bacterium]|nr:flagellar hook-length control protein FliK [Bryobacteraceae bacterium]
MLPAITADLLQALTTLISPGIAQAPVGESTPGFAQTLGDATSDASAEDAATALVQGRAIAPKRQNAPKNEISVVPSWMFAIQQMSTMPPLAIPAIPEGNLLHTGDNSGTTTLSDNSQLAITAPVFDIVSTESRQIPLESVGNLPVPFPVLSESMMSAPPASAALASEQSTTSPEESREQVNQVMPPAVAPALHDMSPLSRNVATEQHPPPAGEADGRRPSGNPIPPSMTPTQPIESARVAIPPILAFSGLIQTDSVDSTQPAVETQTGAALPLPPTPLTFQPVAERVNVIGHQIAEPPVQTTATATPLPAPQPGDKTGPPDTVGWNPGAPPAPASTPAVTSPGIKTPPVAVPVAIPANAVAASMPAQAKAPLVEAPPPPTVPANTKGSLVEAPPPPAVPANTKGSLVEAPPPPAMPANTKVPLVEAPAPPAVPAVPVAQSATPQPIVGTPISGPAVSDENTPVPRNLSKRGQEKSSAQNWTASAPGAAEFSAPRAAERVEAPAPVREVPEVPLKANPGQTNSITVQLGDKTDDRMQIRFQNRQGEMQMAVRTANPDLADRLRSDLPELRQALGNQGFRADLKGSATESDSSGGQPGHRKTPDQFTDEQQQHRPRKRPEAEQDEHFD